MKKRIDVVLFEKQFYNSREKAQQAVKSGRVKVDGEMVDKPSLLVDDTQNFETLPFEFVSRGGFKLQFALEKFGINLTGRVVLDIGASTGGFTDVCLQAGAKKVYCVDTGVGQLAPKILNDKRVLNFEKTNYLTFDKSNFLDVNFVCIDVSFISLTLLAKKLATDFEHIEIVALIKPQFECGAQYAKKHKGIVKDEKTRQSAIERVVKEFEFWKFKNLGVVKSPVLGGDGNVEFLVWLKK